MGTTRLPPDFKDFLKLLNSKRVKYLLIGGYAVSYYGYSRATADIDIWVAIDPKNAQRITSVIRDFFDCEVEGATPELFTQKNKIVRMGVPPFRIEVLTTISGVEFDDCYLKRKRVSIDGIKVSLISLEDLKVNKRASGRHQDLNDLEHLK
ncbi:MAG: nucleotidyltransferase [Planctomycetota bacterium]|nr:nucleotidyltransferase [Planctomycetota bacterium]